MIVNRRIFVMGGAAALSLGPSLARAHSFKIGDIVIGHPWALPSASESGVAFVTLANRGRVGDKLLASSSPVAREVVLREANGLAARAFALEIGRPLAMKPDARHLALLGLKRKLAAGDRFALKLRFENAGETEVEVMVETTPSD